MTKFNKSTPVARVANKEGGLAFAVSPERELYLRAVTCMVGEKKFYQSGVENTMEMLGLIHKVLVSDNRAFVLQLASYCRNAMNLRSIPIMLLGEAIKSEVFKGTGMIEKYVPEVIKRADEIAELLGYIAGEESFGDQGAEGFMVPKQVKKGLEQAFHNFTPYQLEKYNRSGKFSLGDALRLIHAKPLDEAESDLFRYLARGDEEAMMRIPDLNAKATFLARPSFDEVCRKIMVDYAITWEVAISKFGQSKELWEALLPRMGYMATLRNLRNMLTQGVDTDTLGKIIADPERVKRSKQLPFRYYSAWKELPGQRMQRYLSDALEVSVDNVDISPAKTLVIVDYSGSMSSPISERSTVSMKEIATVMASVCVKLMDADVIGFATNFGEINVDSRDTIMGTLDRASKHRNEYGGSTDAWKPFVYITEKGKEYDRIILVSDMQCYDSARWHTSWGIGGDVSKEVNNYRSKINPKMKLVSIDLQGYGTSQISEKDPHSLLIAGFSDAVFKMIQAWEKQEEAIGFITKNY